MKVWSIQSKEFLKVLNKNKEISGNKVFIQDIWSEFIPAYNWMISMMNKRGINSTNSYPIWLWNKRPDRRLSMFKYVSKKEYVILELEIPSDKILWSNFSDWHCVLNGFPIYNEDETKSLYFKEKYGDAYPYMEELDKDDFQKEQVEWENIFVDISKTSDYTQGCVEKISVNQITKVF